MTQKDFPRGGKKPLIAPSSKSLLFEKDNPIKARKNKTKRSSKKSHEEDNLVASTAQSLTYTNLCEGMVILGRVHEVTDYDLIISLPGRISGQVKVTDISESYTNLLQSVVNSKSDSLSEFKTLPELYSPGDNVVTCIKALCEDEKWRVSLSLESNLVNQNLSSNSLTHRSKVVCSISSIEDHGYVIETGIPNVRAFLSKNDVEDDSNYFPGKQIICAVKNIKSADNASIVNLSSKANHLLMTSENVESLDSLLPGTQLTLCIRSVLYNGLQVSFDGDKIGYINQIHLPKILSQYTPGLEVDGTLLYIIPTVKFAYFTLLKQVPEKSQLNKGDIVNGRVLCPESNGILFKLGKGIRGFVPYRRTDVKYDMMKKIFVPESEHKCRVLTYDNMDRVYICTTQKTMLSENHISKESFIHGEIVNVIITEINKESGFVTVSVGNMFGSIPPEHISDCGGLSTKLKVGQEVKAKVLSSSEKRLTFTLKPLLINSTLPVLDNINRAKIGSVHHGTIRQITQNGILVKFFGDFGGWVPVSFLDPRLIKRNWNYFVGEVVTAEIKSINLTENRLTLKIIREKKKKVTFQVGETVSGVVIDSSIEGIQLQIKKNGFVKVGFLPAGHIAPCAELGSLIASKTIPGDELSALVFATYPTLLLSVSFVPQDTSLTKLKSGSTILCSVRDFTDDVCNVILPIDHFYGNATLKKTLIENETLIRTHQILLSKVISTDRDKKVVLSTRFSDLWHKPTESMSAIDTLCIYLIKMKELSEKPYYKSRPISSAKMGQHVEGIVEKVTEHGLVLRVKNNLQATVRKDHYKGNVKVGDKVKGVVLWVNLIHELLEVSLLPQLVSSITVKQSKFASLPLETKLRGTIVLITNWFLLVLLKGKYHGKLVVLPSRLHLNDINPNLSLYSIGQKVRCFVVFNEIEFTSLNICLPKSVFESKNTTVSQRIWKRLLLGETKLKKDENGVNKDKKRKKVSEENGQISKKLKREEPAKEEEEEELQTSEEECEEKPQEDYVNESEDENTKLTIPECGFYWDTIPNSVLPKEVSSSESESEDEIDDQPKEKKKKKLSAAERREEERQKEREIREREEALASSDHLPKSVDQFDRLVLGSPDSSLIWLQYMAYHLQATEVDKARAVAKRAVKTINFREEEERLNVWQAWLNLETKFGTSESLDEVFQEAVKVNDAAKIYAHMLISYSEAGKQIEMEKTANMIVKKFKDQPEMWIKCGAVLLKVGLKEKSRHIMQRAIQSLPPHEHVNLIVRFAHLENSYGDKERSQTLFEQILNTYPKRIDVWSSYVDSLIKSGDIEIARKILERSVTTQVLPSRKMKVLFKKYINFEEQYGTQEDVQNVRELANEYVKEHSG